MRISVGERVRLTRRLAGLSQVIVSKRAKITQSCLSKIEVGESAPSLATIVSIAAALGVSVAELVEGTRSGSTLPAGTIDAVVATQTPEEIDGDEGEAA